MTIFYCTADAIGEQSGGGVVTKNELQALQEFSAERLYSTRDIRWTPLITLGRDQLAQGGDEPWGYDNRAYEQIVGNRTIKLAHFYSGTFSKTVAELKRNGCKVTYTIAAHDKEVSRQEHEKLGLPFPYPHLTQEKIWQRYIEGYRLADAIITPGRVPEKTIRDYGGDFRDKNIRIVPHGCDIPEEVAPLPSNFVVGNLGSWGCDKGVRYLLEAWTKLNYKDGSMLMLAGRDSMGPGGRYLLSLFGGGCKCIRGWVENVSNFYNDISCYCQPSATEGFGIEVLEAMAHGRPALCSNAAGATEISGLGFYPCDAGRLAEIIDYHKNLGIERLEELGRTAREQSKDYTWDKIRERYKEVWKEVLDASATA